jgi:two-component system, chemotaxis family, response regulator Rcp1
VSVNLKKSPSNDKWVILKIGEKIVQFTTMENEDANILIVEDNLAHLRITEYILREENVKGNYFIVRDGQEALDYVYNKDEYADKAKHPRPDLVLLDLNLPQRDGREVLKILNDDADLKTIPVVIVSTSDREEDITFAYEHGAVGYISKSSGFEAFKRELGGVGKHIRPRS